jgi:3-keto-5-aminohexanoate cleavage enzyme
LRNFDKLIITAAICGAELTRNESPYLPLTPQELSEEAKKSFEAGASIVHLHVRDKEGKPSQNSEIFIETVDLIRKKAPSLIVQVSTGGAVWMTAEERLGSLASKPDMATLTTGTCNFGDDVFMNKKETILAFLKKMNELNIMPEFECFDFGHIAFANFLIKKGFIKRPVPF